MKKISIIFSLLFAFTLFISTNCFAADPEYYPLPFNEIPETNYNYVVYTSSTFAYNPQMIINSSNSSLEGMKYNLRSSDVYEYEFVENATNYRIYYYYYKDGKWILSASGNQGPDDMNAHSFDSLLESNVDIYTSKNSDEIFFQKTPPLTTPTVEMMVAEEVPKMAERIIQVMKIILLCGVGCLVLLISLPLFGKVFRTFHVK